MLALLLLVGAGCGYTIAGLDGKGRSTYYIEALRNTSTDMTITRDMRQEITRFFLNNGMLGERDHADYVLIITLTDKTVSASIRSATREALTSDLDITYHIAAEDRAGRVVYDKSISLTQSFTTGTNIQGYNKAEQKAFDDLTTEIFTAFKHEFESS